MKIELKLLKKERKEAKKAKKAAKKRRLEEAKLPPAPTPSIPEPPLPLPDANKEKSWWKEDDREAQAVRLSSTLASSHSSSATSKRTSGNKTIDSQSSQWSSEADLALALVLLSSGLLDRLLLVLWPIAHPVPAFYCFFSF